MKRILVLYTALADYMLNSFLHYAKNYDAEFHIIHWPIRNEAPFVFPDNNGMKLYNKSKLSNSEIDFLIKEISPDTIICSGWTDKDYIKIIKKYNNNIPTILTMDNHWQGNFKQQILRLLSPLYLKKIFSHIWVPGEPQKRYAMKLSFKENQILTGYYVANDKVFNNIEYKQENTFVYIGRYIKHKGVSDLWTAFLELKTEFPNNWKLQSIGTGDLWDKRVIHKDIEHLGFVQPNKISDIIKGGVFILPSHFEPWGVVVHEFAMAGFPMIISDKVGAGSAFLKENGFLFDSGNINDLKKRMKQFMTASSEEIKTLSVQSKINSTLISNESWSKQLNDILEMNNYTTTYQN